MKKAILFTGIVSLTLGAGSTYFYFNNKISTLNEQLDFVEKHVQAQQNQVFLLTEEANFLKQKLIENKTEQAQIDEEAAKAASVMKVLIKDAKENNTQREKAHNEWLEKEKKWQLEREKLTDKVKTLHQILSDSGVLYEKRYRLSQGLNTLNKGLTDTQHLIKNSQKACEEFEKGNSWNWVSEKDCENNTLAKQKETQLKEEVEKLEQQLLVINQQLLGMMNKD